MNIPDPYMNVAVRISEMIAGVIIRLPGMPNIGLVPYISYICMDIMNRMGDVWRRRFVLSVILLILAKLAVTVAMYWVGTLVDYVEDEL